MIDSANRTLGRVVALVAMQAVGGVSDGPRPALRIAGFDKTIVESALREVAGRLKSYGDVIVKVGTTDPIEGVPTEFLLRPGEQLTAWRNITGAGAPVLLFDWGVPPDVQGLSAISRLDDAGLLKGNTYGADDERFELFIQEAWKEVGGEGGVPSTLAAYLLRLWHTISAEEERALRRWSLYLVETSAAVVAAPVRTLESVQTAISSALPSIGLFPDRDLYVSEGALEARILKNVRVSGLKLPSGAALSEDDLVARIDAAELSSGALGNLALTSDEAKKHMRNLVMARGERSEDARRALDLGLWLELFEHRIAKLGLGRQVRVYLEGSFPERLEEYDSLLVEGGLDRSEQESAERFLFEESPGDALPLADLLLKPLRRRIEKVAFPDSLIVLDPLRALLHELTYFDDEDEGNIVLRIEGSLDHGEWTRWLFAFLYGKSLQEIRSTAGLRLGLDVQAQLLDCARPPLPDDDEPFDAGESWATLRILVEAPGGTQRRFRWDPLSTAGQIAVAALIHGYEPGPGELYDVSFDSFFDRFTDPREWLRSPITSPSGFFGARFFDLRRRHFGALSSGFSAELIGAYLDEWRQLLTEARAELVPANAPDPDLSDVVLSDVIQLAHSRLAMLATHPLRLRWLARHYTELTRLITKALTERLSLNPENSDLFFETLERVSPHGTPAMVVGPNATVAIPMRESAGHEEYAPVREGGNESREWLAAVDEAAIEEMVRVILSYVGTYPQKLDGLSVLLLDRNGDPILPVRVAKRLRAKNPRLRLDLVVLAPPGTHHEIIQAFDSEFSDVEVSDERFLPDVQLVLKSWDPEGDVDWSGLDSAIDIALAPALFGTRTSLNASTRDPAAIIAGRYDPWIHAATRNLAESSENVVLELLPSAPDAELETWSTLCVRYDRMSAVAREKEGNTDYFEMQVKFDQNQKLFLSLHTVAHWVVTLDSYIGRDQIDALNDRPDVILVKPGVGKNESYTLIVSSQTGKQFVVQRLGRRLAALGIVGHDEAPETAARLFGVGRNVVPGSLLRAMGIGTTINEIVGLVATRFVIAQWDPVLGTEPALVVWLSFDEQQRWFGRGAKTRADLGRFVLTLNEDGDVILDVLVAESKFRQTYDHGAAEEQLNRTTDLCRAAFSSGDEASDDHTFWIEELASAIEQTSKVALKGSELPARQSSGPERSDLEARVLEALRGGNVRLRTVRGVAIAIAAGQEEEAPSPSKLGKHTLIRMNRPELRAVIGLLRAEVDPTATSDSNQVIRAEDQGGLGLSAQDRVGVGSQSDDDANSTDRTSPAAGELQGPDGQTPSIASGASELISRPTAGGLGESQLRSRYNKVLDVFSRHGVKVRPPDHDPWQEGPGFYVLRFVPEPGVTVDKIVSRRGEVFLALELPSGFSIRTRSDRGSVIFEIPKIENEKYGVLATDLWHACPVQGDSLTVPIGADISGNPVSIDFSSPDSPHLLVAGTTGSGKSVALDTILKGLTRYDASTVRLQLVDPKGTELLDFENDPHLDGLIGMDAKDAIQILEAAVAEMDDRYRSMKEARARKLVDFNALVDVTLRRPWIVIVLDEYADLTSDPDEKRAIEDLLKRLTQKARAAGIHVIAATQRPSADVISTTIRSNFPAQLALRVKTATDSRIILDETGAEALAGQGDAFLHTTKGTLRLQVAYANSTTTES